MSEWTDEQRKEAINTICAAGSESGIAFFGRHPHLGFALAVELQCELAAQQSRVRDLEAELRKIMWLSHGHRGIYGDDGEMQCGGCVAYGCGDYLRQPMEQVRTAYQLALHERAALAPPPAPQETQPTQNGQTPKIL